MFDSLPEMQTQKKSKSGRSTIIYLLDHPQKLLNVELPKFNHKNAQISNKVLPPPFPKNITVGQSTCKCERCTLSTFLSTQEIWRSACTGDWEICSVSNSQIIHKSWHRCRCITDNICITSPPFGKEKCCPSSFTSTGACFIGQTRMILLEQEQKEFQISIQTVFFKQVKLTTELQTTISKLFLFISLAYQQCTVGKGKCFTTLVRNFGLGQLQYIN